MPNSTVFPLPGHAHQASRPNLCKPIRIVESVIILPALDRYRLTQHQLQSFIVLSDGLHKMHKTRSRHSASCGGQLVRSTCMRHGPICQLQPRPLPVNVDTEHNLVSKVCFRIQPRAISYRTTRTMSKAYASMNLVSEPHVVTARFRACASSRLGCI